MKVSIIGAGSTYTPELIEGIGEGRLGTPLNDLVLMDIDRGRLDILGGQRTFGLEAVSGRYTVAPASFE